MVELHTLSAELRVTVWGPAPQVYLTVEPTSALSAKGTNLSTPWLGATMTLWTVVEAEELVELSEVVVVEESVELAV